MKKNKNGFKIARIIILLSLLLLMVCIFFAQKFAPDILFMLGEKSYNTKDYKKAVQMFESASKLKPNDKRYKHYKVLALAKMPLTYENQKELFEIATSDNKSTEEYLASEVLTNYKNKINHAGGPNYIKNAIDNEVMRWDTSSMPLKYYIIESLPVPPYYINIIKDSFSTWESKSNGLVRFKEVYRQDEAQIVVTYSNSQGKKETKRHGNQFSVATTEPVITDNALKKMNIEIQGKNLLNRYLTQNELSTVMLHEIGHALGIWGHSPNPNDIMYYSVNKLFGYIDKNMLSDEEINTLKLLYSVAPDITNKTLKDKDKQNLIYAPVLTQPLENDYSKNIRQILIFLSKNPDDLNQIMQLAFLYGQIEEYKKSVYVLQRALPLVKDARTLGIILFNISVNYINLEDYENALKYAQILEKFQNNLETKNMIIYINYKLGNISMAETQWKKLILEYPSDIEISTNLANLYISKKQFLKARAVLKELLKNNPDASQDARLAPYSIYTMF